MGVRGGWSGGGEGSPAHVPCCTLHGVRFRHAVFARRAEILYTLSDLVIMVLFLMIAQGWRLTDEVPSKRDQMLIGGAVLVYCVCYTIIYTVDYALRDPASEVYVLLTTGAFFLALIRCMCAPPRG